MKSGKNKIINRLRLFCLGCSTILLFSSCSSCKPVLYPNKHYKQVGPEQAQKDVEAAIESAKQSGLDDSSSSDRTLAKSASRTAASTTVSTASSVASGSLGTGTAISAGGNGLYFLIDWMFTKKAPQPLFKKHVELTLQQQGYQVIGWK